MIDWLSGLGTGLALLQGLGVLLGSPRPRAARWYALLMVAVVASVLHPLASASAQWLTQPLRTAIPALFWWLSILVFSDRPRRFRWLALLALYTVLAPTLYLHLNGPARRPGAEWLLLDLPQLAEYALILHALAVVALHWRDDLVQSRRQMRVWLLGFVGVVILASVSIEQLLERTNLARLLIADLALLATGVTLLTGRIGILLGRELPRPADNPSAPGLAALEAALAQGLYRKEGLTLADFARAIGLPEYRARQLINNHLGFRNFPDFLNHYRLADAGRRLRANPEEPVTSIALDVGFRSVSSFNRVFKEHFGQTPSAYRRSI